MSEILDVGSLISRMEFVEVKDVLDTLPVVDLSKFYTREKVGEREKEPEIDLGKADADDDDEDLPFALPRNHFGHLVKLPLA